MGREAGGISTLLSMSGKETACWGCSVGVKGGSREVFCNVTNRVISPIRRMPPRHNKWPNKDAWWAGRIGKGGGMKTGRQSSIAKRKRD